MGGKKGKRRVSFAYSAVSRNSRFESFTYCATSYGIAVTAMKWILKLDCSMKNSTHRVRSRSRKPCALQMRLASVPRTIEQITGHILSVSTYSILSPW